MNTKSKAWLMGIVLLVVILAVTACSSSNDPGNEPQVNEVDRSEGLTIVDGKFDPPVTLTTVKALGPNLKFREGETIEDNIYTRIVKEQLGIDIEYLWTTSVLENAYETKLMLSLSSGEQLPDVMNVPSGVAQQLIDSGKFRAVDDLFEQYAGEKWKEAARQSEVDWYPYLRDGRSYAIPSYNYKYENEPLMFIRQDWLDNLGLQAPTNISELEAVMEAFVHDDPDGNGLDDTIGLAVKMDEPALTVDAKSWIRSNWVYGSQGALPGQWDVNDQGEVIYGSIKPEIKDGLALYRDWFNKGYLHREFGLHDEMKASELFINEQAGIIIGVGWVWAWPLNALQELNPDAVVQSYPVPTGDDGMLQIHGSVNHYNVTLINKDMEHPEIYFALQNFFYEEYADPKEGGIFEHGLAEGYDWANVNGEIVTTDAEVPGGAISGKDYSLDPQIARIPELQFESLRKLAEGHEPETPFERRLAQGAGGQQMTLRNAVLTIDQEKYVVPNAFLGAPTETMIEHADYLIKLEQETFNKIIYGELPLEAFDEYVENFLRTGGEKITQEVKAWYDANMQ
ncbi:extracellular solute-binding protein [Paenibacillus sp. 1P07SE]|uniref:extracellular solute-binding protein n=1 Tax=Paenibacillus sp. 1P07SE TaxID=3132209 RepID=UPI0039A6439A